MNTSNGFQEDGPIHYTKFSQTGFAKKGVRVSERIKCLMAEEVYLPS